MISLDIPDMIIIIKKLITVVMGFQKRSLRHGDAEISVPRDRNGDFEPQMIKKNQSTLPGDIEEKIISMYVKGIIKYYYKVLSYINYIITYPHEKKISNY